jgi:hypothetical protein
VKPKLSLTRRQLVALERAIRAMNLAGGRISVSGESDLLTTEEMLDLRERLANAVETEPDVEIRIDF